VALVKYIPERDAVGLQRGQPPVIRRVWVDSEKLTDDWPEQPTRVYAAQNRYLEPQTKILTYI
jgi:hypothetical protein